MPNGTAPVNFSRRGAYGQTAGVEKYNRGRRCRPAT
jgi:hypothetical protein